MAPVDIRPPGYISQGTFSGAIPGEKGIERRRRLADVLAARGTETTPVQHWTQAAARMANSLAGALGDYRAGQMEQQRTSALAEAMRSGMTPEQMYATGDEAMMNYAKFKSQQDANRLEAERQAATLQYAANADARAQATQERVANAPVRVGDILLAPPAEPGQPYKPVYQAPPKPPSASQQKLQMETEGDVVGLGETINQFRKAEALVGKGYEGYGAETRANIGAKLPGWAQDWIPNQIAEPKASQATIELQNIMSPESITMMANTLKGSTAYQELLEFKNVYADPSIPNKTKMKMIQSLRRKAEGLLKVKQGLATQMRGEAGAPTDTGDGGGDPLVEAQDAIARGADRNAVIQRLQEQGIDPTGL